MEIEYKDNNQNKENKKKQLPNITIIYKNVTVNTKNVDIETKPNIYTSIKNVYKRLYNNQISNKFDIYKESSRITNVTGIQKPGTMTMVIASPGHGKSSFLKALANRIEITEGSIQYNGYTSKELYDEGINVRKLVQYIDQIDEHLPQLTVYEVLEFAHKITSCEYNSKRIDEVISTLGLDACRNTFVGNSYIRGISGGQLRRLSIGEVLVSDARALFLDSFTNGLDTATSEDIGVSLNNWAKSTSGIVVASLQQPTPGLLESFDNVIILREGNIIYQGPMEDIIPYIESMGCQFPPDVDTFDFISSYISEPKFILQKQREIARRLYDRLNVEYRKPFLTTQRMVEHYEESKYWKHICAKVLKDDIKKEAIQVSEYATNSYKLKTGALQQNTFNIIMRIQWTISMRDKTLFVPRLIQGVILGILYGTLYMNLSLNDYFVQQTAFDTCVAQAAFDSMVEVTSTLSTINVVYKQIASNLYSPLSYVISLAISLIPFSIGQPLILSLFIYFLSGAVPRITNYLIFLIQVIFQTVNLAAYFRMLAIITPDESTACAIAGPTGALFALFSGQYLAESTTPKYLLQFFWLSPFSWTIRALANNEFLSPEYDKVIDGVRMGSLYMEQLGIRIGNYWIYYALLYLSVLTCIFIYISSLFLWKPNYEPCMGTQLLDDTWEDEEDDEDNEDTDISLTTNTLTTKKTHNTDTDDRRKSKSKSYVDSKQRKLHEKYPFTPYTFSFSDIRYTIKKKINKEYKEQTQQEGIYGYSEPGTLTAQMGESGAGKTTLLNVLSFRTSTGTVDGKICVNGKEVTKNEQIEISGYVEQFDTLSPFDTVRETLLFVAKLYMPTYTTKEVMNDIIDEILDLLELKDIQHMLIGGANSIRAQSPSQIKRISICVELVRNPSILFFDEPTTGLDSRYAYIVMHTIKRVARSGRSIICTIHQPSAELFYLFDYLVLLGKGGKQIYFGDLGKRAENFIKYFQSMPGVSQIAPRYNPATWMLEELGIGTNSSLYNASDSTNNNKTLVNIFSEYYFENKFPQIETRLHEIYDLSKDSNNVLFVQPYDTAPIYTQFWLLLKRIARAHFRNPYYMYSRFLIKILFAILQGLTFFQLDVSSQTRAISFFGVLAYGTFEGIASNSFTVLRWQLQNRMIMYREKQANYYEGSILLLAFTIVETIYNIFSTQLVSSIIYLLIGQRNDTATFFKFFFANMVYTTVFQCSILQTAYASNTDVLASIIFTCIISVFIIFSGVSIPLPKVLDFYKPLFEMIPSIHITAMYVMPQIECKDINPHECGKLIKVVVDGEAKYQHTSEFISNYLGFEYFAYWKEFGYVCIYMFIVFIAAIICAQKLVYKNC